MDKFLSVELIICSMHYTWNTEYVFIPYPETVDEQKVKDDAIASWHKWIAKKNTDEVVAFVGVYNINWDEPIDESGEPFEEEPDNEKNG